MLTRFSCTHWRSPALPKTICFLIPDIYVVFILERFYAHVVYKSASVLNIHTMYIKYCQNRLTMV